MIIGDLKQALTDIPDDVEIIISPPGEKIFKATATEVELDGNEIINFVIYV